MGRPKKAIKKVKSSPVHMTVSDRLIIERKARLFNLSISEYLLKAGLSKCVKARLTEEEVLLFRQLTAMGNNLNQIARRVNQTGLLRTSDIEDLMKVKELIKRLL